MLNVVISISFFPRELKEFNDTCSGILKSFQESMISKLSPKKSNDGSSATEWSKDNLKGE